MAAKKKKLKMPTKSAFVKNLPADMPAKEISALAKKEGLVISPGYVYEIRSADKRRAKKRLAEKEAVARKIFPKRRKKPGPKPRKSGSNENAVSHVVELFQEASLMGFERAIAVLRILNTNVSEVVAKELKDQA